MANAKLIMVVNQKGGCGKTTLSVHLAGFLHRQKHVVAVLDPEGQLGVHTWLSKAAPEIGVLPIESSADLATKLPALLDRCEYVVADASPGLGPLTRATVELADLVIIPTLPSGIDIRATMQAVNVFHELGRLRGRAIEMRVVINRYDPRTKLGKSAAMALAAMGYPITNAMLSDREAIGQASSMMSLVWNMKDRGARAAAAEFEALFKEVVYGKGSVHQESGRESDGVAGNRGAQGGDAGTGDAGAQAA